MLVAQPFHILLRLLDADDILNNPKLHDYWKHARNNRPHQYFANFFNAYARTINDHYGRTGSLFQRPFRRISVTTDAYFFNLITYIHRNPQKHGFVDDFHEWPYTSYDAILHDKQTRVSKATVLDWFGSYNQFVEAHQCDPDEKQIEPWLVDDWD